MHGLRNQNFRRPLAGGLAVLWLFTVLACAADTDALSAAPDHSPQLSSSDHPAPVSPTGNGSQDDACCQVQAAAVMSSAVKLPQVAMPAMTPPLALLLVLALPLTLPGVAVSDQDTVRRRSRLLIHSLQAQAPPR